MIRTQVEDVWSTLDQMQLFIDTAVAIGITLVVVAFWLYAAFRRPRNGFAGSVAILGIWFAFMSRIARHRLPDESGLVFGVAVVLLIVGFALHLRDPEMSLAVRTRLNAQHACGIGQAIAALLFLIVLVALAALAIALRTNSLAVSLLVMVTISLAE